MHIQKKGAADICSNCPFQSTFHGALLSKSPVHPYFIHFHLYQIHNIVISSLNNFAVRQIQINLYFPLFRSLYHEAKLHDYYLHSLRSAVFIIS